MPAEVIPPTSPPDPLAPIRIEIQGLQERLATVESGYVTLKKLADAASLRSLAASSELKCYRQPCDPKPKARERISGREGSSVAKPPGIASGVGRPISHISFFRIVYPSSRPFSYALQLFLSFPTAGAQYIFSPTLLPT
ncbi:hypothetical protein A0H81_02867 [Grifola frondosa]|uniref:Uncharacterized protein n=1 Tax=Grifola frondosa TaxID=5627 RepID=A0A1C7MSL7_GRIFR|nr:hypothetical protein A0H81_02867 [Grifola frondosa]